MNDHPLPDELNLSASDAISSQEARQMQAADSTLIVEHAIPRGGVCHTGINTRFFVKEFSEKPIINIDGVLAGALSLQ